METTDKKSALSPEEWLRIVEGCEASDLPVTELAADTNKQLLKKPTTHPQQVNKAISFHALKDKILLLMFDPPDDFNEQVQQLFLLNPTLRRPDRIKNKERLSLKSNARSLHFQKFARKVLY